MMKKFLSGAVMIGVLFAVSGCATGPVLDKQAPGEPGNKTFQIRIRDRSLTGPDEVWITVPERVWDECRIGEPYRECEG